MGVQRILCDDPLLTQQSAAEECDINLIVEKAKRGADLSQLARTPIYGDFTNMPDYRQSLLIVNEARDKFLSLDANIRKKFDNDPAKMLDFLNDPKNRDEAVKLGLVKAPEPPKPDDPVVSEIKGLRKDISDSKSRKAKPSGDEE